MNILLVYPEFPDTFWSFKHALKFIGKKASQPPLGLVTVAAMLPPEYQKRLVDLNAGHLSRKDLAWADYIFISAMAIQQKSAREVIARAKASGVKVVAGGPLFTEEYEQFEDVDHFVLNEAELTLPPFLEDLEKGCPQRVYKTAPEEYADLRQTPIPMWELINLRAYDAMSIQFTRGCPFHCEFCNVTALLGRRTRTKSAAQIVAELDKIYSLGWRRSIFFVDDNFIGNKRVLKDEILPAIIEWRRNKKGNTFITEACINLADDGELMRLMQRAGFKSVFVGIESPDENSLREANKNQNKNRNLLESVKRIHQAGLQVMGGFIVGFDSDTPSIFGRQIEFIQKSGIVAAMVGLLQAPQGTRLYNRLKKEKRLVSNISGDNVDGKTNIIPKMGLEILRKGYKDLLSQIYSPRLYYKRVKTFMKDYRPRASSVHIQFDKVLALFRSMYRLGIWSKERIYYWRLFFWTLLICPRNFPLAITFAVYGYHFRKVNELRVR